MSMIFIKRQGHIILEDQVKLELTQGQYTLIDLEDFERISKFNWFYHKGAQERAARMDGRLIVYIHHEILRVPGPRLKLLKQEIDHINGETLDNRKCNLRIVSHHENMQNTKRHKESKGICFHLASRLYIAYVSFPNNGRVSLGYWRTEDRAIEIATLGKELQKTYNTVLSFKEQWKKVKPRDKYDRSKM